MKIHVADSQYWKMLGEAFQKQYVAEIERAYKEANRLLPFGSTHLNFFVQPSPFGFIKETGNGGFTFNSGLIQLRFDPECRIGKQKILENVRAVVFHEMNHAARWHKLIWHTTPVDMCIFEGLATVFERDYANWRPLWSKYKKDDAKKWLKEVKALPDGLLSDEYRFKHSDGRRWISYKVGTYLIDEAMANSSKTVIELTQMECADILGLARKAKK